MHVLYGAEACSLYTDKPADFEARQASAKPFVAKRKSNTVLNYISSVQAIYKHFGVNTRLVSVSLSRRLQHMHDDTHAARSFHVDKELRNIYETVCALRYWNDTKKLLYWTMTLVSTHTHRHTLARTQKHTHTLAHRLRHTRTHTRTHTHTHTDAHTHTHTHSHTHTPTRTHTHTPRVGHVHEITPRPSSTQSAQVAICIMARASCVTKFCPLLEDIELPPKAHEKMWAKDGLPHYVVLKMRNWKGRKIRTPYKLRIWRNLLQADFADPVFFLMVWIKHLSSLGITSGPIFPALSRSMEPTGGMYMKTKQWTKMVQHVFEKVRCTRSRPFREGLRRTCAFVLRSAAYGRPDTAAARGPRG